MALLRFQDFKLVPSPVLDLCLPDLTGAIYHQLFRASKVLTAELGPLRLPNYKTWSSSLQYISIYFSIRLIWTIAISYITHICLHTNICNYSLMVWPYRSAYPLSRANLWKAPMGSEPVLKMNTRGVLLDMSWYRVARSTGGVSINCLPRFSITKSVRAKTTWKSERKKMLKVVCGMRMFYIPIPVFSLLEKGVLYFDI